MADAKTEVGDTSKMGEKGAIVVEKALEAAGAEEKVVLDAKIAEAEVAYKKASQAAAGTSKVTGKKLEAKALEQKEAAFKAVDKMRAKMGAEKAKRIKGFMKDAASDRKLAKEAESKLLAKAYNAKWKDKAKGGIEKRVFDGHSLPQTARECNALYNAYKSASPYEAAYIFLVNFYRLRFVSGGKSRSITTALMLKALHPDCLMEKDDQVKIRKHTLLGMKKSGLENVVCSYFAGADPDTKHPLNEYKVDEKNMSVQFQPGEGSYESVDGKTFKVEVYSHGCQKWIQPYRVIEMKYDGDVEGGGKDARWKAYEVSRLFQAVVPPFNLSGAETQEDLEREREYRKGWDLAPAQKTPLKAGPGGSGYYVPVADHALDKVDVIGTQMGHKRAAYDEKMEKMDPVEKEKRLAEIKSKREIKAKAAMEDLAKAMAEEEAEAEKVNGV